MTIIDTIPTESLPTWMRRALRPTDWGALISLAFGLLIALPMLMQPSFIAGSAHEHYIIQTANTATALTEGRLYPRWSPHVLGGYGAPIPHYYPPAPAYSAALAQIILTGDPTEAVRIVYLLALWLAGMPVYALVARHSGAAAGTLASMLYVCSPHIHFTTPLLGDLPAAMAHLLVPLLLWAIDRLFTAHQPSDFVLTALASALVMLTDWRFTIIAALLAAALIGWHSVHHRTHLRSVLLAQLLGAALASFYWLPALLELSAVTWRTVTPPFAYRLTLGTLFQPLQQNDPLLLTPMPQFTLGIPLAMATMAGLLAAVWRRNSFHGLFLLLGISITGGVLLVLPQQTWLLGAIALCLSIGGSSTAMLRMQFSARLRGWVFALFSLLIITAALPAWLTTPPANAVTDVSPAAQVRYELQGLGIAGLPAGWALPSTVPADMLPNRTLVNSYLTGQITRIDVDDLTGDVQIGFLQSRTHSETFQIETNIPALVTVQTAWFPGWAVNATAGAVTARPNPDTGMIDLIFPAAFNSDLTVYLGSTPPRTFGWMIAITALIAVVLAARQQRRTALDYLTEYPVLRGGELRALLAVLVITVSVVISAQSGWLNSLQTQPGSAMAGAVPVRARTDAEIELVSYRWNDNQARAGETIGLTLYWRALRFMEANYRVHVSVVDPAGNSVVMTQPLRHPGAFPTRRWQLAPRYLSDAYDIPLPADITPGNYVVRIEVFNCEDVCAPNDRLRFYDTTGVLRGRTYDLPLSISP
ncbi:MAG: 6-pyruvoyl-tetrahydropterin synthase-related protein [Chloroflexota bacterium]|nr:6-pyruvoyl-tetrahydropterin synthase-related protein [Chloroflexota bacterium]